MPKTVERFLNGDKIYLVIKMEYLWIPLLILALLVATVLIIAYICFKMAFYEPDRKPNEDENHIEMPEGEIYEQFREKIEKWTFETRRLPHEELCITSFDGLKLYGKFYEYAPDAPMEIMFHGYRGCPERDLSGGVQRCFKLGRSALIVEQRASGKSEGNVISFGVNEHRDCLMWTDFAIKHFGPDVKIILTGISMGAATVLMAAGKPLPTNVIGVLADCGYTSAKDIIKIVIKQMKLPPTLAYPFVKLGARLYGHFNLEETPPIEAVKNATVPIIFYHGEADDFVPCYMSEQNFNAANCKKMLVTVKKAGHGLSYPVDPTKYLSTLRDFFGEEASFFK